MTGVDAPTQSRLRWFHVTPGRFVLALLTVEGLLWLSESVGWLPWHQGYAVLAAVAIIAAALVGMTLWFAAALIFHRRFQFSIRSLLVLALAVAAPCSWLAAEAKKAKQQKDVVFAIQLAGGEVYYEHQFDSTGNRIPIDGVVYDNPVDEYGNPIPGEEAPGAEKPGPTWLRQLLGDDFFRTAVQASVGTEDALKSLPSLIGLKRLRIDPQCRTVRHAPAARMSFGASLHDTRSFYFSDNSPVTDDWLQPVEKLVRLQELEIQCPTQITDEGLEHLKGLKRLTKLRLWSVVPASAGLKRLQQALPRCTIEDLP
jgi:hypothetical protein